MTLISDMTDFGLAISQLCEIRGWSQRDLAQKSGVSRGRINKIFKSAEPSPKSIKRIADAFGVDVSFLMWLASACRGSWLAYQRARSQGRARPTADRESLDWPSDLLSDAIGSFSHYRFFIATTTLDTSPQVEERIWAELLWSRMQTLTAKDQLLAIEVLQNDERMWALAERLCWASEEAAADRAEDSLRLAQLAVLVARKVPGEKSWCLTLQGLCNAFLGNALRVSGDLAVAEQVFTSSEQLCERGAGGDPKELLDSARRFDLRASLLMNQGKTKEALVLLEHTLAMPDKNHDRGRLTLKVARALELDGCYKEAIQELLKAKSFVEPQSKSRDHWGLHLSLAINYCHLDRHREAESLLLFLETTAADLKNQLDSLRLSWLKGRILSGLGRRAEAIKALSEVRQHFHSQEIAYDFALVSLELATLYLEEGQTPRVKEIAEEIMAIFQSQKVHKEALAALTLFCHAARREEAEAEWTRGLVKYLYRAQHNPGLRFEP